MAPQMSNDDEEYAKGFEDERAPTRNDDDTFAYSEEGGTGGMDVDAAAAADSGEKPNPDAGDAGSESIVRQTEGGGPDVQSAADNGAGGNTAEVPALAIVVASPTDADSPIVDADPKDPNNNADDEPTNEKDLQRKRSWEGRLKAEEQRLKDLAAELEAKKAPTQKPGDATADALDAVADKTNDPAMTDAANEMAARVDSGEISPEDAMSQLADDFGQPFVDLIKSVATAAASKAMDGLKGDVDRIRGDVDDTISHIKNGQERSHFEAIAAAHPDFREINKDPAFDAFVASQGPEAEAVRTEGSAADINKLIDAFKASNKPAPEQAQDTPAPAVAAAAPQVPPTAGPSEAEIDAASGVRGGGMELPQEPSDSNDFAAGWNDAEDVAPRRG